MGSKRIRSSKRIFAFLLVLFFLVPVFLVRGANEEASGAAPSILGDSSDQPLGLSGEIDQPTTPEFPTEGVEILPIEDNSFITADFEGNAGSDNQYPLTHINFIYEAGSYVQVDAEDHLGQRGTKSKYPIESPLKEYAESLSLFSKQRDAVLVVNPTAMHFTMVPISLAGGGFPTVNYIKASLSEPNADYSAWTLVKEETLPREQLTRPVYTKSYDLLEIFPELGTNPGTYLLTLTYNMSNLNWGGSHDTHLFINPEFIIPAITLEGTRNTKDPTAIRLSMSAFLLEQSIDNIVPRWTIAKVGAESTVLYEGKTETEINDALKRLEIGKYTITYSGTAESTKGYTVYGEATQALEITKEPEFSAKLTLDLAGGFHRDGNYYNPEKVSSAVSLIGSKPPGLQYTIELIEKSTNNVVQVFKGDAPTFPSEHQLKSVLESAGMSGEITLRSTLSLSDVIYDVAEVDFIYFSNKPVISLDRTLNPKSATISTYFDSVEDNNYAWEIVCISDAYPSVTGKGRTIPTNIFASLNSLTHENTRYYVEFTETYADGHSSTSERVIFNVKRPLPFYERVGDDVYPSEIILVPDQIILDLGDANSYRWEITTTTSTAILKQGEGLTISSDVIYSLTPGAYYAKLYQTFEPYKNGFRDGTGYATVTFYVDSATSITAAPNMNFGAHEIQSQMVVPWESVNGETASSSPEGKVEAASVRLGSAPIKGITLKATPLKNSAGVTLNNTLFWGSTDKNTGTYNLDPLETAGGVYVFEPTSDMLVGTQYPIYVTDNADETEGFFFVCGKENYSKLRTTDYSATLTWTVVSGP